MLSKKVFLAGELIFSAPPARPTRANVRDHIESQEGDHRATYASDTGQQRRQLKTDFREIWGAAQFSTFSTASVNLCLPDSGEHVRIGQQRTIKAAEAPPGWPPTTAAAPLTQLI
jgi:hypothetical protein